MKDVSFKYIFGKYYKHKPLILKAYFKNAESSFKCELAN